MKPSFAPALDSPFEHALPIELEAHHPDKNIHRYYRIDVTVDLLGDWVITTTYGRIGQGGQCKTYGYSDQEAAKRKLKQILNKRFKAHKRLGTPYRITQQNKL